MSTPRPTRSQQMKKIRDGAALAASMRAGMRVLVRKDDGAEELALVDRDPWQLGHGAWVIGLEGFSGGYDITRCRFPRATIPIAAREAMSSLSTMRKSAAAHGFKT